MTMLMAVAGVGLLVLGLVTVALGLPYRDFSIGGTSITAGVMIACAGAVILGLWMVVRELQAIARRLGVPTEMARRADVALPMAPVAAPTLADADDSGLAPALDRSVPDIEPSPTPPSADPAETPPVLRRRNLLFSSRKGRERTEIHESELPLTADLLSPDLRSNAPPAAPAPAPEPAASPAAPTTFDDAWPRSERARPAAADVSRRAARPPLAAEPGGVPAPDRHPFPPQEKPSVTVLKSGVVDGMAYSLYSDGSIEAQMPEGMMRFASIDELRSHLEQRP